MQGAVGGVVGVGAPGGCAPRWLDLQLVVEREVTYLWVISSQSRRFPDEQEIFSRTVVL